MPGLAVSDRMEKFEPSPANRYKVALRTDSNTVVQFLYKMCDGASNIYLFLFLLNIYTSVARVDYTSERKLMLNYFE